jgi:FMN phosphatase YigB (HAD superfamily)
MAVRRAVTFDLWHTLLYLEPEAEADYLDRQLGAAVEVLAASPPRNGAPGTLEVDVKAAFEAELKRAVTQSHQGRTVTSGEQMVRAAAACGRQPRPEAFDEALGKVVAATPFRTTPGALETLAEIRRMGPAVGILSNTVGEPGRFLRDRLRTLGFDRVVEVYTFSDEHPWTKPAPEIFHWTLEQLGSEPASAIHVGDGWADLEGARRAGLYAGVLYTGSRNYAPEYQALNYAPPIARDLVNAEVRTLADVIPIVTEWLKR